MMFPWTESQHDGGITFTIDRALYDDEVIARAAYAFTNRCYVLLSAEGDDRIRIDITAKRIDDDMRALAGEFANALLDQKLRRTIARETRFVRELIVAQAFCEGDLLDRTEGEADVEEDPRRIAVTR
jgi:His-Xaa-Ser system protein HxsD